MKKLFKVLIFLLLIGKIKRKLCGVFRITTDVCKSTITQQLAKNMYFTQEKKMERKIAEVFMAWKIEDNYSKEEIFELYVNNIFFGDGYYTVKEAARRIF